ncbi:MAG: FGGY family carbohydrate kinase [Rhizobiaceae bacterium]|nr:FGGY family carbohydrate kinase [Rhizobiaceae bacterium]
MTQACVIGVDIGSSAVKATAFNEDWIATGEGRRSYSETRGPCGEVTLSVRDVLAKSREAIGECFEAASRTCKDARFALSIASVGEILVPVDANGHPLADAILNGDARLSGARQWWSERIDPALLHETTGLPMRDTWAANVVGHHLRAGLRPARFLTFEDMIVAALGVRPQMSLSLAARSMMLELRAREWSSQILDVLGIDAASLPPVSLPGRVLGTTARGNEWGLPAGIVVASGGHDQFCAAVGTGASPAIPMWSTGTVDSFATLKSDVSQASALPQYEVDDGVYMRTVPNLNGGRVLSWLSRLLNTDRIEQFVDDCERPERLLVVPTFGTTGAPDFDPDSTGMVVGLTYADNAASLAAAAVEGIVLETRQAVLSSGIDLAGCEAITVAGGSARSSRWLGLKADAFGLPVLRRRHVDAGIVGAAMLARRALDGTRVDVEHANPRLDMVLPTSEGMQRMDRQAARYASLRHKSR